ncbi:hypothetical protein LTR17_008748 [Elasticomyces elasticus]|nr:hypothetical protein LTR17_008748 [Elasticomyces elasticus]
MHYDRLPEYKANNTDNYEESNEALTPESHQPAQQRTIFNFLPLGLAVVLASFMAGLYISRLSHGVETAWARIFDPSPIARSISLRADVSLTDTRLMPNHPFSATSHVQDQVWSNISSNQFVWITEDELVDLSIDTQVAVRTQVPSSPDQEGFAASVTVLHNLHCLQAIRNNMKHGPPWSKIPDGGQGHLQHCVETIRQALVCAASTDITPFVWYDDEWSSDFLVKDKCGNFDGVTEWAAQRSMNVNPFDIKMPRGQKSRNSTAMQRMELWY